MCSFLPIEVFWLCWNGTCIVMMCDIVESPPSSGLRWRVEREPRGNHFKHTPISRPVTESSERRSLSQLSTDTRRLLLERGAAIDSRDVGDRTPLFIAAHYGQTAVVELLIRKGANVRIKDGRKFTPLGTVAEQGHLETLEFLLRMVPEQLETWNVMDQTPLALAARNGHTEVVKLLLRHGANGNARSAGIRRRSV